MRKYLKYSLISLFLLLLSLNGTGCHKPKLRILLVPFQGIPDGYIEFVRTETKAFYFSEISVHKAIPLPESAWYSPRKRYRADSLIRYLRDSISGDYDRIVGLTDKDISTTKGEYEDWGIMGLGFMPGKSCVVSTFRVKRGARGPEHIKERLAKVVMHEIGHTLGLPHCTSVETCLMRDAGGKVITVDQEDYVLCSACSLRLGRHYRKNIPADG